MDTTHDIGWLTELHNLDKNVRLRAVMALGQAADVATLPALLDHLRVEPDFFVRDNLSWAIARCGDGAVIPLIAMLTDADAGVLPALTAQIGTGARERLVTRKEAFEAFGDVAVPNLRRSPLLQKIE